MSFLIFFVFPNYFRMVLGIPKVKTRSNLLKKKKNIIIFQKCCFIMTLQSLHTKQYLLKEVYRILSNIPTLYT